MQKGTPLSNEPLDILEWLTAWYVEQCESGKVSNCRISIRTVDNPGWSITISTKGLAVRKEDLEKIFNATGWPREIIGTDWMDATIEGEFFRGHGGPEKLEMLLATFKSLVK